ncbi:MAG TPA: AfsR/SARP family transcriptional regulator [Micromonosporaceae bacterium]|nr:AfsR/SARP family transcriptional regulator [Micromonosporaceae bacterium]
MHERRAASPDDIRFRILGSLEFFDGERWHPIAATKQRLLLAALLLNANRIVPTDQLITELWADQVPATAQTLLAGYVWRLRRTLSDPEGRIVVTRAPGYGLVVRKGNIDVDEYERLVARARLDLTAGRAASAVDLFGSALALWRGAPLADLPPTLNMAAEIARLEESRLAAIEAQIGAQLVLGQHEAILPDLKLVVSQFPLRERLQAHLMMALYRAGQPAEALGAYRDLRRLLVDELGIEPSEPLRTLERRILSNDPSLLLARAGAAGPGTGGAGGGRAGVVVRVASARWLPADPVLFVGRGAEVCRLAEALAGTRVAVVHGLAGAGKTTLAVHIGYRLADRYPDGRILVDLGAGGPDAPATAGDVVRTVAGALGLAAVADAGHAPSAWRALLAGRRLFVVLDDVACAAQVRDLVPVPPGSAVVATARSGLSTLDGAIRLRVGALPIADCLDLLHRHLDPQRVELPGGPVADLVRRCERLPLALRIAAARLVAHPDRSVRALADRLTDPDTRLDVLTCDELSVRASLQGGAQALARAGRTEALACLGLLGALALPVVDLDVLAALLDRPPAAAEVVADQIVDAGLVEALAIGRYRVPELTQAFARECDGGGRADTAAAVQRVVRRFRDQVAGHLAVLSAGPGAPAGALRAARAWFRGYRGVLSRLSGHDGADELRKLVTELRRAVLDVPGRTAGRYIAITSGDEGVTFPLHRAR